MIRVDVSGGDVTRSECHSLIGKYASESTLNKRNDNMLIALATRAEFNPREIALANDPNTTQEFDLCVHQMDIRN